MNVVIRKIGNSEGVIIPKEILDRFGLKAGDQLEIIAKNGGMHLQPVEEDFSRQMEHARRFMDKYKVALKKLAE
ncbi:AbrB/MazE/SpoVT family DNA-binding domain-containing protein [Rhizobium sp. 2YAF20]|uniref:AbrB/MazE/SpoVT family DNA-binding domain-containing protein n=1 Tax=Rhizobium sp. 2YAF20 TaxID=3233027 RepID=UPI003F9E3A70